jgi:hypothetical protein
VGGEFRCGMPKPSCRRNPESCQKILGNRKNPREYICHILCQSCFCLINECVVVGALREGLMGSSARAGKPRKLIGPYTNYRTLCALQHDAGLFWQSAGFFEERLRSAGCFVGGC